MKLFAVGALAIASLLAQLQAPDKQAVGYNVGVCRPDGGFLALHFEVNDSELDVTYVNSNAGEVDKLEPPMVFKKISTNTQTHVVAYVYEDGKTELDLTFDKGQVDGKIVYEDKEDHVFGAQGAVDGLAADGIQLFTRCQSETRK